LDRDRPSQTVQDRRKLTG